MSDPVDEGRVATAAAPPRSAPARSVAPLPGSIRPVGLARSARVRQHLGDHRGALALWRQAAQADRLLAGGGLDAGDLALWARAESLAGDADAAWRLAGQAQVAGAEAAGQAMRLQRLLRQGRGACAMGQLQAWLEGTRSAQGSRAALQALAWMGQAERIDAARADVATRLDAAQRDALDLSMPELLATQGRWQAAWQMLRARTARPGGCVDAQARLAALLALGAAPGAEVAAAVDAALRATADRTDSSRAWALYARGLQARAQDRERQASADWREAAALQPQWWRPRWALGELLLAAGAPGQALDWLHDAVECAVRADGQLLATPAPLPADAGLLDALDRHMAARPLVPELRFGLGWALAAARWRLGDRTRALAWQASPAAWDDGFSRHRPGAQRARNDALIAGFSAEAVAACRGGGRPGRMPVFVVGLPAAGQQQLAAALQTVPGVGIVSGVAAGACARLQRQAGADRLLPGQADAADIAALAARWQRDLAQECPGATRVVDIGPGQAELLGLIKLAFPQARVLWCRRDPAAHALALCFDAQLPRHGADGWRNRLAWIDAQLADHQRLMAHWCALYGEDIVPLDHAVLEQPPAQWLPGLLQRLHAGN